MDVRAIFAQHGLRCTRQRELVYAALAATDTHPTAEELHTTVRREDPGVSLATVYNTLDALTAAGLARRIPCPTAGGPCRFDADTGPHIHMAIGGSRVVDLPSDLSERLLAALPAELLSEVERRMGVTVRAVNIQLDADPAAGR